MSHKLFLLLCLTLTTNLCAIKITNVSALDIKILYKADAQSKLKEKILGLNERITLTNFCALAIKNPITKPTLNLSSTKLFPRDQILKELSEIRIENSDKENYVTCIAFPKTELDPVFVPEM